jgi:exonuclease SbcD
VPRILLVADTHLGFDQPRRPRIERRRRGEDFFANYDRVLQAARAHQVNVLVHGGDVLFRSRVPPELVQQAFLPLRRLADEGVEVFVVPGNHERSRIPYDALARHARIRIFDRPRTFTVEGDGVRIALVGFPCCRRDARHRLPDLLDQTAWRSTTADAYLLCVHQSFEGATVGPNDFTFRYGDDVMRPADVPGEFAAVLAGHIHRHQVLTTDLAGRALPVPVLYPGSIERTSFAEKDEPKGYLLLDVHTGGSARAAVRWSFHELPARPMIVRELNLAGGGSARPSDILQGVLRGLPPDAVLQLRVRGIPDADARATLSAAALRATAPSTMNVEVKFLDAPRPGQVMPVSGRPRGDVTTQ